MPKQGDGLPTRQRRTRHGPECTTTRPRTDPRRTLRFPILFLGSLWPAAEFLQPYSLFHYLKPKPILLGEAAPLDLAVLATVVVAAMTWALGVFPRRYLAAPSAP